MAAVVWRVTMSLDGFIAGPDDAMDWVFDYFSEESSEDCKRGDRVHRRNPHGTADQRGSRTGIAPGLRRRLDRPVLRPHPRTARGRSRLDDRHVHRRGHRGCGRTGDRGCRKQGRRHPRRQSRQAVPPAGLLDELVVHLAPMLLGDGVRLFAAPGGERVRLDPILVERTGPLTDLRFRVSSRG
jgi:hypothetical protein